MTTRISAARLELGRSGLLTEILLDPLSTEESATLAVQVAGEKLTANQIDKLCQNTAGNPLFVVETIRAGFQEGSTSAAEETQTGLPPKVYAVIQWRLSQLSSGAQVIARLAAVIGRSFTYDVLLQAGNQDENMLVDSLDELWRRRIVLERGEGYDFSHDRLRDVAYTQISAARRRLLHQNVADTLEQIHAHELDVVSSQLAAHYEQANCLDQSLKYHLQAGQAAVRLYANEMAIAHFQRGLALLEGVSSTQQSLRQELSFHLGLMSVLTYSRGRISFLEQTLLRAGQLAEQLDETEEENRILWTLSWFYRGRAEFQKALAIDEKLLNIAETTSDLVLLLNASYSIGGDFFYLGEFHRSRTHLEMGTKLNRRRQEITLEAWKTSYGLSLQAYYARLLWMLGFPDQALSKMLQALALGRELDYAPRLAFSLFSAARLRKHRREISETKELAEELINFAENRGFPQRIAHGKYLLGWSLTHQDRIQEGIDLMCQGLDGWTAAGTEKHRPDMMATIAEAHARNGEPEQGLALLAEVQHVD